MVGIKRIILTITLAVATCVQLVAQSNSESFAERQCKQLRIRQENVNKQLTELHKAHAATPSDSISVAIYELNKQSIAIGNAINRLSAQIEAERMPRCRRRYHFKTLLILLLMLMSLP